MAAPRSIASSREGKIYPKRLMGERGDREGSEINKVAKGHEPQPKEVRLRIYLMVEDFEVAGAAHAEQPPEELGVNMLKRSNITRVIK